MSGASIPKDIRFPKIEGVHPKADVIDAFKECPFITYMRSDAFEKARVPKRKRDKKTWNIFRDKIFSEVDKARLTLGGRPLKYSATATRDLDVAVNVLKSTAGRKLRSAIINGSEKLVDKESYTNSKAAIRSITNTKYSTTITGLEKKFNSVDPQGYVATFEQYMRQGTSITMHGKSTIEKYFRSFRAIVKEVALLAPSLQEGINQYITNRSRSKIKIGTLKSQLAAVKFFSKNIAITEFDKSIKFTPLTTKNDPAKHQPIFPTEYYEESKFKEFCKIFADNKKSILAATLALFSGLRIFEIAKLKVSDFVLVKANKSTNSAQHYVVNVIGKGGKERNAMVINKNAINLIKDEIALLDSNSYLL